MTRSPSPEDPTTSTDDSYVVVAESTLEENPGWTSVLFLADEDGEVIPTTTLLPLHSRRSRTVEALDNHAFAARPRTARDRHISRSVLGAGPLGIARPAVQLDVSSGKALVSAG